MLYTVRYRAVPYHTMSSIMIFQRKYLRVPVRTYLKIYSFDIFFILFITGMVRYRNKVLHFRTRCLVFAFVDDPLEKRR